MDPFSIKLTQNSRETAGSSILQSICRHSNKGNIYRFFLIMQHNYHTQSYWTPMERDSEPLRHYHWDIPRWWLHILDTRIKTRVGAELGIIKHTHAYISFVNTSILINIVFIVMAFISYLPGKSKLRQVFNYRALRWKACRGIIDMLRRLWHLSGHGYIITST